ncbi:MAG: class I SAM-dependent methyltransferase [Myxococcota bacterium]|nr:class I SAM-dependent methyltransferase [Myxococcota bacterium]
MTVNTTDWNRIRYGAMAPFYDLATAPLQLAGWAEARRRSIELLELEPGSRVLIVGAGTGLDLEWIPAGVEVVATDLSPQMVEAVRKRAKRLDQRVDARVMDGESLAFEDESFDHVILHLILAVMPDPEACAREVNRVLVPGGRVAIFDKFVPDGESPSLGRRAANVFTNLLFSDFTRRLGPILDAGGFRLRHREKAVFDFFTIATAEKKTSPR